MGFQRLAGGVVWSVLLVITWLHTQFVAAPVQWWLDNVVGTAEESAKATVRELFSFCARLINGIASWIVSVFVDRDFLRRSTGERRTRAWKAFWANSSEAGTLNAIIEREGLIDRRSPSPTPRPRRSSIKRYNWGWGLWRRPSQGRSAQSTGGGMKRSGSDLFNRPSGFAVAERLERRTGLLESMKVSLEIAIETVFDAFRSAVRTALLLRAQPPNTFPPASQGAWDSSRSGAGHRNGIHRTHSFGSWEEIGVWTASDVIIQAGYPLEEHVITTSDGYILTMQRIPRKGEPPSGHVIPCMVEFGQLCVTR